ncbi:retinol dehydrogenase 12-like [Diadema antillarum]|uniref:retinol dehydrogenase 12-like n=1 Tax=Diadema antillarum TaxID=105358 RepID=UPI003A8807CC
MGSSLGSPKKLPEVDMSGKTIIVTGANTGIGYETAKSLAQVGARVILACRSETKALEAIERMKKEHVEEKADANKARVKTKVDELDLEFMALDLGSLASTKSFAEAYRAKGLPLHVLVCNAGLIAYGTEEPTADGFEIHFQVNYLSHFLLTLYLLPVLKSSGPESRIVSVSSLMYRFANWDEADFQTLKTRATSKKYANSKLYQIMNMFSLSRRLDGSGVSVFSLHPGVVDTDIARREGQQMSGASKTVLRMLRASKIMRSSFDGALTTLHATANPEYDGKSALYFESGKPQSLSSLPRSEEKQELIWKYSMDCLKDYVTEDVLSSELTSQ